jgi:hypothetical protein
MACCWLFIAAAEASWDATRRFPVTVSTRPINNTAATIRPAVRDRRIQPTSLLEPEDLNI